MQQDNAIILQNDAEITIANQSINEFIPTVPTLATDDDITFTGAQDAAHLNEVETNSPPVPERNTHQITNSSLYENPIAGPSGITNSSNVNSSPLPTLKAYRKSDKFGSPFKNYLEINEDEFPNKKEPKSRPKMPPAVTGEHYVKYLEKKRTDKMIEEEKKKKRKEEREKNKLLKSTKTKNTKGAKKSLVQDVNNDSDSTSESSSNQDCMLHDDEDDELEDFENICFACGGDNEKSNIDAWIGCNYCSRWYHKECLGANFETLSREETEEMDFKCNI